MTDQNSDSVPQSKSGVHFVMSAERYRAEADSASSFWSLWLPLLTAPLILGISAWDHDFFKQWLQSERTGLLEFIHFLFPLITALIAIRLLFSKVVRGDRLLTAFFIVMALGGIYLSGEEASWGQHWIGWSTPEFWQSVNDQQETNLHNTSFVLDQWPLLILKIGIWVGTFIVPWLLLKRPGTLPRQFDFVWPALPLLPLSILIVFTEFYNKARGEIDLRFFELVRGGEFQELYIVWFLLYYACFLLWRARDFEIKNT